MPTGTRPAAYLQVVAGRLAQDLTAAALTAEVVSGDNIWPAEYPWYVIVGESTSRAEIVKVTGINGQTWAIERGQLGTSGVAHPAGETVSLGLARVDLARLLARLEQPVSGGGGGPTLSGTVTAETTYAQTPSPGSATTASRGDHTHGSPAGPSGTPTTSAPGDPPLVGTATTGSRDDHRHGRESFGSPGSSAVGDSTSAGAATTPARSDHRHGREGFGSPTSSAPSDAGSDGVAATLARTDHRHGREGYGAVTAETAYGQSPSSGAAATLARSDHSHGTPAKQTQTFTFNRADVLAVGSGTLRWYPGRAITLVSVRASVGSAPAGSSILVDLNRNGVTVFSNQSNRPAIAAGAFTALAAGIDVPSVAATDFLSFDVDQVGASTPGSDLSITCVYTVD